MATLELEKVKEYLEKEGYNIETRLINEVFYTSGYTPDYNQIVVNTGKVDEWDVVSHPGSYGGINGLLETYCMPEDKGDVTGYMTAEDLINRLEERKKGVMYRKRSLRKLRLLSFRKIYNAYIGECDRCDG